MAEENLDDQELSLEQIGARYSFLRLSANTATGDTLKELEGKRDETYSQIINRTAEAIFGLIKHTAYIMEFPNHQQGRDLRDKFISDVDNRVKELTTPQSNV